MADPNVGRLAEIAERLEDSAQRLSGASGEEAARLAGECAELASDAAAELDRLTKATPGESPPGQEELL